MSLETLLQAAKYVEYHSEAKARGEEPHDYDTYMRLVSTTGQPSIVDDHDYNDVEADNHFKSNNNNVSLGGSGDSDAKERRRAGGAGTREVHNKLEKNRRAHLKECFDTLRRQLPNMDDKKTSNLSILRSALRYVQTLKRKEREYENELERLAQEKIKLQRKLARTKKQYCSQLEQSAATLDDRNRPEQHEADNDTNSTSTASECGPPSDIEDETTAINNSSPRFPESTDNTAGHQDIPTERPSPYIPQFTQMVMCSPATVASSTTSISAHPTVADGFTNKKPTVTIAKAQSGSSQLTEHHHTRVLPPPALAHHGPSQTSGHKPGTLGMNGVSTERFATSVQNADVKGSKQPIFISKFKNAMQAPSNNSSNKLSNNIVNCAIDSAMLANTNKIARLGVKPGTGVAVPTALAFPAGTLTLTTSATSGSSSVSTSRQVITATVKTVAGVHPPLAQIAHVMAPPSIVTTMGPLVMPHLNHTMAHVIGHQQQLSKVVATTQGSVIKSVGVTQIPIVQQQFLAHHHQHIQPQPMVKPVVVVSSPSVVMAAQNSNQTSHVQVTLPGR